MVPRLSIGCNQHNVLSLQHVDIERRSPCLKWTFSRAEAIVWFSVALSEHREGTAS